MSKPIKIQWLAQDEEAVCKAQTLDEAGNLLINGSLSIQAETPYAEFKNLERTVSLTSAVDLSDWTFTISGYYRGKLVSQEIPGPNATTDYTTQLFTTITSVYVDGELLANISIGSGDTGQTFWARSDHYRTLNDILIGVNVIDNINYTFQTTPDDPFIDNPWILTPFDGTILMPDMVNATTSLYGNYTQPTHSSRVVINSSDATGELDFYFLQQG